MVTEWPWQAGLIDACAERCVNLIIFAGGALENPDHLDNGRSRIFELAAPENIDGLLVASDYLGHYAGPEKILEFCRQYRPLPIVKYEPLVEGYPTLLFDFYAGMFDLVTHLIEIHGCTKIGYITGPEASYSIQDRLRAYQDALAAHGIAADPNLIVGAAPTLVAGRDAVRVLLDERRLIPGQDLHAIVGFYDLVAAGALQALQERGISVPGTVAVVGFDDDDAAIAVEPRLTTVRIPFYELGRWGAETLADLLAGRPVPPVTTMGASLVIRSSCGCPVDRSPGVSGASRPSASRLVHARPAAICRDDIVEHMVAVAGVHSLPRVRSALEDLLTLLLVHADTAPSAAALQTFGKSFEQILNAMRSPLYNVDMVYAVLAVLERDLAGGESDAYRQRWLVELVQAARGVASEWIQHSLVRRQHEAAHLDALLHELNQALATALSVPELVEVLARELPRLQIPTCYLSLYVDPEQVSGNADLVLAITRQGRKKLAPNGIRYAAKHLTPDGLTDTERPSVHVVLPLFHRREQMGFVVIEAGPHYGGLYEGVREQISSALKRIDLHAHVVEARRQAEQANALKSQFLSTVTHELRTPLSMIVHLSEVLLQNSDEASFLSQRQDLDRIHAIGQHLDRLVLDVLELGRSQLDQLRIDLQPLHIGDLLQEVALVGEQMAKDKGLEWRMQVPPSLPEVLGDRGRLRQVLFNLIGNAVKFTARGDVTLLVSTHDSEVLFAVSDTGLGIPATDQALIFDEFRQSERTAARGYGGMGLGLAITRRLVELHGGTIWLRSSGEEGSGATFYFTVPIAQNASAELNVLTKPLSLGSIAHLLQQHGLTEEADGVPPTILIVDDEPQMLRLHSQLVRRHLPQLNVVEASSGRQALEQMRQAPPDLVLLDLMMPELDGFGVLAAMQAHVSLRSVPVIIMTAQVLHEDELLRLNRCVAGVLGKGIFSGDETAQQIGLALQDSKRVGVEPQRIARRTMAYIHAHYAEHITRGHMARHIGVNERYLTHCFHQSVGVTPMEYLNRYRVNVAKGLLESEHMSIGEIALDTGFASSSQFSRVFRQHTGMSPTQYVRSRSNR